MKRFPFLSMLFLLTACAGVSPETAREELLGKMRAAAKIIAKKVFSHYKPEGLDKIDFKFPVELQDVIKGVRLSKEDRDNIKKYNFTMLNYRKSAAFSKRYEIMIIFTDEHNFFIEFEFDKYGDLVIDKDNEDDVSDDLKKDVAIMWSVNAEGASTDEAVLAASRVFNTVNLIGKDKRRIFSLIGDDSLRPKGKYNFSFWPGIPEGDEIYRFDNGMYGWQFNVTYDENGICVDVERNWIH